MENRFASPIRARGTRARPAVLDALAGLSGAQSWVKPFSVQDRTLVILIENGGVDLGIPELAEKLIDAIPGSSAIPGSVKRRLIDFLRKKITDSTDALIEGFELTLNRYNAAKGSLFGDVVVLRDGTASYNDLRTTLINLTRAGKLIDLFILTHGSNDFISVPGGIDSAKIRELKTANGGPLSIRSVYMMNCVGSSLNQAWLDAGARASCGSIRNNYLPEPTMYFFWQAWKDGKSFEAAATGAYRKTVNLMDDAVHTFVGMISGLVGGLIASRFSLADLDFVKGSAPLVQGQGGITITSDDLSFAKSLSSALAVTVLPTTTVRALTDSPTVTPQRAPGRVSPAGLDFIKGFETLRTKLHNDAYGHCSIGYGTVLHAGACDDRPVETDYKDGITEAQAADLLAKRLAEFQELVNERVVAPLGQNQNDAIVSFVSDVGVPAFEHSKLLKLLNQGNAAGVVDEMRMWTKIRERGALVESPDLVKRRAAEAELFAKPDAKPQSQSLSLAGAFGAADFTIPGILPVIAQPTPNTCWAAVFTMMYSWKNNQSFAIRDAVGSAGGRYRDMFDRDIGLDSATAKTLYKDAGLESLESFNPTIDGWLSLLKKYGPLYVDVGYNVANAGTHAIIVTALAGDGTPSNTSITYVDPWVGSMVTLSFNDFLTKYEARSAVQWPYTIVHWPAGQSVANSLPISHAYCYESEPTGRPALSRAQFVPAVIAGIEVADAAQIGLAAAAMVQAQAASSQGSFTLTFDKAERLLTNEARQSMPGARTPKQKYTRLLLHLPKVRAGTAYADIIAEWEGNAYGEIGTVIIRRDLAKSSEFSRSSANISFSWVRPIPVDGVDPRAWPIVYSYDGTFDPMMNGYWEFHGEVELNAFGGVKFNKHEVFSRSLADWPLAGKPEQFVQRGPAVIAPIPDIPQEQIAYLKTHLP